MVPKILMLHYVDDPRSGGSLRVGETICRAVDPTRYEMHMCFAYRGPGPIADRATWPCHYLGLGSSRDVAHWGRIRRLILQQRFDILHYQDGLLWSQFATVGLSPRRVMHVHILTEGTRIRDRLAWRVLRHRIDKFICITRQIREKMIETGYAVSPQAHVVYNAIDFDWFQNPADKQAARKELGLPSTCKLLGMVGRQVWWKGGEDLLRILAFLPENWHGVFVGAGVYHDELKRIAMLCGVEKRAHFVQALGDVRPAYASLDAFGFFSRFEPFGLVIAEAMASRVPVVGLSGEGGYAENEYPLVTADNALLLPRANPKDHGLPESEEVLKRLAEKIVTLDSNGDEKFRMVERAHRWVRERFSLPIQGERIAATYDQVLGISTA